MMDFANKTRIHITIAGAGVVLLALALTACGGGETPQEQQGAEQPQVSEFVVPLAADSPELQVAGPGGVLPCGAGDVQAWGRRKFNMADYPECVPHFPNLAVYCLDGSARWTDATVSNVSASADEGTVAFDVQQEGFCALFPQ
jgi:hypothetical protein